MTDKILQPATRSVVELNRWLAQKSCPPFAGLYATAGIRYGVAWDIAIFQSCLETNWFRFGGDVDATQNNFAGLGASGGGAHGDAFLNPQQGIEAQIQNLALRAGKHIPMEQILSPYTRRHYTIVAGRNTPLWSQLAGTYATDKEYWNKIKRIMSDFDAWQKKENPNVTWFRMERGDGGATVCRAFAGSEVVASLNSKDKTVIMDFLHRYPNARNVEVGEGSTQPTLPPASNDKPLAGKKICVSAGHSPKSPGSSGKAPDYPREYEHNLLQAKIVAARLSALGAAIVAPDPDPDNLEAVGRAARGCLIFLDLHHNAANADGIDEGVECWIHRQASASSGKLAELICAKIANVLRCKNRGVKNKSYTVLDEAKKVGCGIAVLVESYFIDDYGNATVTKDRSTKSAHAIADAVIEFLKSWQ